MEAGEKGERRSEREEGVVGREKGEWRGERKISSRRERTGTERRAERRRLGIEYEGEIEQRRRRDGNVENK